MKQEGSSETIGGECEVFEAREERDAEGLERGQEIVPSVH